MPTDEVTNPYMAGWGLSPPHFAGRKRETRAIVNAVAKIKGAAGQMDHSPAPAIVLLGPRGVGKTVLLARAMKEAAARGIHTSKISRNLLVGSQKELVSHAFPGGILAKIFEHVDSIKLEYEGIGMTVGLKEAMSNFRSAILAFLTKKPLLLVLDEAHHCEPKVLNLLFEIVQDCMSAELPLAFILAGTPGLRPLMQRCDATYVERSKILRINILSNDEANDALEIPAKESGRLIEPPALKLLLDWSDNYPYFIQLVGAYAWDASDERVGKEISIADAKSALADADLDRVEFYEDRYEELKRRHLADHAIQVVSMMRELGDKADTDELERRLMEMNEDMDSDRAMAVTGELQEVGFIWRSGEVIEPGIPSMFDHIARKQRPA